MEWLILDISFCGDACGLIKLVNLDFVLRDYLVNLDFVFRDYMRKMKIPDGLLELGYSKEDIPDLVKGAIPQVSINYKTNF